MHVRGVWGRNTSRARVSTNLQPQRHGAKHIVHLLFCCPFSAPPNHHALSGVNRVTETPHHPGGAPTSPARVLTLTHRRPFEMSSRRSMLGGLSASQANTRSSMSLLVGDGTPHSTLKSSATRKSLGGGARAVGSARDRDSGVRRSGAFMKGSTARSDPRPLGDKPFQQACIRSLISFLTANGYDHAVSPKLLSSPTAKEFMHIVQFLFRKVLHCPPSPHASQPSSKSFLRARGQTLLGGTTHHPPLMPSMYSRAEGVRQASSGTPR